MTGLKKTAETTPSSAPTTNAAEAEGEELEGVANPGDSADTDQQRLEDLRRFQVRTMPPELRAELMFAKAPLLPPEQLQDTAPPNKSGMAAPAQVTDPSRKADTVILPRTQRRKRNKNLVYAAVVAVALTVIAVIVAASGNDQGPEDPAPREDPTGPAAVGNPAIPAENALPSTTTRQIPSNTPTPGAAEPVSPEPSGKSPTPRGAEPRAKDRAPRAPTLAIPSARKPSEGIDLKKPVYSE